MQLAALRVRNIRSYRAADLRLGPGTTLLVGDVGSGKTSLLYAIEMALFGFAEVDPTYLVRHRATEAEVLLTLTDPEHRYELGRRFQRKVRRGREVFELKESSYAVDGARVLYSATEVRQRAIDLLGFPDNPNPRAHSDLWRWAVYVPQERMRAILEADPEERLETVRKALGLEQYRTAADNAALAATAIRRTAEHLLARASGLEHFERSLAELTDEAAARVTHLERLTAQLEARRLEADRALAEEATVAEGRRTLERDRAELAQLAERDETSNALTGRLGRRLSELAEERARLDRVRAATGPAAAELERLRADAQRRSEALPSRRAERDRRERAAADLAAADSALRAAREAEALTEADLGRAGREATEAGGEVERWSKETPLKEPPAPTPRSLSEIDREIGDAQASLERAVAEHARLAHVRAETAELLAAGVCPRCHQAVRPEEFGGHLAEAERAVAESESLRVAAQERRRRLEEERRARERFERARARFEDLERTRASARASLAAAEARRAALERRRGEAERDRRAALARVEALRPEAEALARLRAALAAEETAVAEAHARITELATTVEGGRAAEERVARAIEEEARIRREIEEEARARAALAARGEEVRIRLRAAADLETRAAEAARSVGRARTALESAHAEVARETALLETARRRAGEAEAGVAKRRSLVTDAAERETLARWIGGAFREGVLTLEHRLLSRAQTEFDRRFTRYFAALVEDPSLAARSDAQFSPAVEIDGELTPPEALSGGERTALALAFRLALGAVVRDAGRLRLDSLILDEPTDGFSPEQVMRMGELFEGLGIPQVLLVSHEAQLAAVADRVIRVRKEGGASVLLTDEPGTPPAGAPAPQPRARRVRTPRLDGPTPGPADPT